MRTAFTSLILFIIVSLNTVAQDSAQPWLPEGAKARLDVRISDDLEFSPDGTRLAISGGGSGVRLYDLATDDALTPKLKNKPSAYSVACSPDSETLGTAGWDSVVRLWDVEIGKPRGRLPGNLESVRLVAFSPDGRTLACGAWHSSAYFGYWSSVSLLDVATGSKKGGLNPRQFGDNIVDTVHSVAYSSDNRTFAAGSDKDIYIWDAVTEAPIRILEGHTAGVNSIAFSPDGRTLAGGSSDGTVLPWKINPLAEPLPDVALRVVDSLKAAPDVDGDGGVDVQDLMLAAARFGQSGQTRADVNGDGI